MSQSLISVRNVSVEFPVHINKKWPWSKPQYLQAVRNVSFDLNHGQTLGVVGESGCGKSTLARAITRLVTTKTGEVIFDGQDILTLDNHAMRPLRREIQMIFQDPQASLNPRMTIGDIMSEPLRQFFPKMTQSQRKEKIQSTLDRVGILSNNINRYPHEFSGGQCQRIGIARALILQPKLLICDEPVSALDVSIQAQVVNLLKELQDEMGLAMIFVAHDVSVIRHVSDNIMVMYLGQSVEYQKSEALTKKPQHPYTQALLSAVPIADPDVKITPMVLNQDLPSPLALPQGCAFSTRCPYADEKCKVERPKFVMNASKGIACFKPLG